MMRLQTSLLPALLTGALLFAPPRAHSQASAAEAVLFPDIEAGILPSNSVSHLAVSGAGLWAGTSKGLAVSSDRGTSWKDFSTIGAFAQPGIYSIAVSGATVWVSTGYNKEVSGSSVQTGSGYAVSTDNGLTWTGLPQPLDARNDSIVAYGANSVYFLPIVVPEQNVTFSSALRDSTVWIASWSSGLRKSTDLGRTWQRTVLPGKGRDTIAPTDVLSGYAVDPRRENNFLAFSVALDGPDTVWCGTAGGINRSIDGGRSWRKFTHDNSNAPIASDWVIAVAPQHLRTGTRIWTTNWPAEGATQEYAVSYSDDAGQSWTNLLKGTKAYGFAFRDSVAYIATVEGVYRTPDGGQTWLRSGTISDPTTGGRLSTTTFYAVAVLGDTLIASTADGIARTLDSPAQPFGSTWQIIRAYVPSGARTTVYAYPNPFSPAFESTRIHFTTGTQQASVTIEVFDFGMNRVRTVLKDAPRMGENDELWDGTTDGGVIAANGVYFFKVTQTGSDPAWGKILLLR